MRILQFFLLVLCAVKGYSQTEKFILAKEDYICDGEWELVFEENFNGPKIDLDIWRAVHGIARDADFSSQKAWHTEDNLEIENGILNIVTKKENYTHTDNEFFEYSSGEIWTKKKFGYGKFEARVKLGKGKGVWPAFWIFGHSADGKYQEIDIYEFWNQRDPLFDQYLPSKDQKVHHMSIHYDHDNNGHRTRNSTRFTKSSDSYADDYHVFSVVWDRTGIFWYVDDELVGASYRFLDALGRGMGCRLPSHQLLIENLIIPKEPMHIILNTAVQCNNNNEPDKSTPLPSLHQIDWVRYYQRKECTTNTNIQVTSNSDIDINPDYYNSSLAENITFDGSFTVNQGVQYELIAKDFIELKPGFETKNAIFEARINDMACTGNYDTEPINPDNTIENFKNKLLISPNPSTGHITIELLEISNIGFNNGLFLTVSDVNGIKMLQTTVQSKTTNLDLSHLSKGVYFVHVNSNTFETLVKKVILN